MPRALLFDESGTASEIIIGDHDHSSKLDKLIWINLRESDDFSSIVSEAIDKSMSFREDLMEEQRPRTSIYQTLEDNEDTYTVVVLAIPTSKIFTDDNSQLQITFIFLRNRIYSIASAPNNIVGEIMAKALHRKRELNRSSLFHFIIIELFEMGIRVLGQIEDYIDQLETQIIRSSLNNQLLTSLLVLKSRLYDMGKFIRADLEPIREIMEGEVPEIDIEEFSDQPEDRALYLIDLIDAQREELSNLINLHLAIASNNMNRRFYWLTILGSLLIVPSIVSGIFGMNVVLPDIGFWELLILMLVLTVFTAMIVKWLIPNNQLA